MSTVSETIGKSTMPAAEDVVPHTGIGVWESLAYAGIVGVGAALRLYDLAAAPLSLREAAQALAAWEGAALPQGGSPILLALNQLLFGLFGASVDETGVRLGVALCGTLLVALPLLFRSQIGRYGALGAALLLAVSPTLVAASRTLDGQIVVTTCALAASGFGLRYLSSQRRIDLIGSAASIGLLLAAGQGLVTIALALIPTVLIAYKWVATAEERAIAAQTARDRSVWRETALWGGAVLLAAGTVLLLRPASLANVPESISAWLGAWDAVETLNAWSVFLTLLVYETAIAGFGLAGAVLAARRLTPANLALIVWPVVALGVAALQPGRQILDLALVLPPLAVLSGLVIEALTRDLIRYGAWQREGMFGLVAAVLTAFMAIRASNAATGLLMSGGVFLGLPLTQLATFILGVLVIAVLLVGMSVAVLGRQATLRAGGATLFVLLIVMSFSAAWRVAHVLPGDPRELVWGPASTSAEARALREAVEAASRQATGTRDRVALAVTLPQDDALIRWTLRDFKNAQVNGAIGDMAEVIVAPLGSPFPEFTPHHYVGKPFAVQTTWDTDMLTDNDVMRWWLYRESDAAPSPLRTYVVWVNTDRGESNP